MRRTSRCLRRWTLVFAASSLAFAAAVRAAEVEPDHFRGTVVSASGSALTLKTDKGKVVQLVFPDSAKVYALGKATFEEISLGTYVGSVAVKPGPDTPRPTSSLSYLHVAIELRIMDESLRGIALGERKWDLRPNTIIAHGYVDDLEFRALSIKYGATDMDETDVQVPLAAPIQRMSYGERALVKRGARIFAGATRRADGRRVVDYVMVGRDGVVPAL